MLKKQKDNELSKKRYENNIKKLISSMRMK